MITKLMDDDLEGEMPEENSTVVSTNLTMIPKSVKSRTTDEDKINILLRDQLDCSSIINGIDKDTGKAEFKLPLIGLPNFSNNEKVNLYYNGNNKVSGVLGVGWSFPFNAIMMDHQGSVSPENEKFFLYLENFPLPLSTDPANSTDNVYSFKLSDENSKLQIRYFKNEERWEVDFMGTKQIYGRREGSDDDSISYELTWKYWRGVGSSSVNQVELSTIWFLTELRSGQNSAMYYTYDVVNVTVPESGKKFTREAYLKTIRDNEGNEITFKYAEKNGEEYHLPPLKTDDGIYNTMKVHTRYLSGYSLTSYNYRQDINFIYGVENAIRLLIKIEQNDDPTNLPVLQFSYKKIENSHQLEQVFLPTDTSVEFSYEISGGTSNIIEKIDLKCDVQNTYSVDYGQDFVLISYVNSYNHVVLQMFNRELTSEMYSSLSESETTRFPFLGKKTVHLYEVKILEDSIAIILIYDDSKDICLIHKEKDMWSLMPKYYNYDKDAMIQIGDDYITVMDPKKILLETIVWDEKSSDWIVTKMESRLIENSADSLIKASGKVFFIYDDNFINVAYRNKNEWKTKPIVLLPGVIKTIKSTLNKFHLEHDTYNEYLNSLKNNAFQMSNNLLLINRWNLKDTKTYSEVDLLFLNSDYSVISQENHEIFQDDLTEVSKESEVQFNDKIKVSYTLMYKKDGDRFKVYAKNVNETTVEQLCKDNENENCVPETKWEIEQKLNDFHKNDFILKLQKYFTYFRSPVATLGSIKFTFTGDNWKKEALGGNKENSEKWSVPIADKFLLEKENSQSSVKLYIQEKTGIRKEIFDLEFKNITQIFNIYPDYLVYETESEDINILFYEFLDNANIRKLTLPKGETVSLKSSYSTIITHAQSSSNKKRLTLYLRQLSRIKSKFPNPVIKKLSVAFDNDYKRTTGYDYDQSSIKLVGSTLHYEKTYVIPGNKKSSYGFVEQSKNITGESNVENRIYDAQGNLIKIVLEEQSRNNTKGHDAEEIDNVNNSELYDVTGHLKVAQFYPYEMQDDEVSYYGFEDYEINKIGAVNITNQNRWFFNEDNVVKQEFSLTGENYLSLNNNSLVGLFQPQDQNQTYVASCWVRQHKKDLPDSTKISPYLMATVYTDDNQTINGYFGEVKYKYDDWTYLEVVVDLLYSKLVFTDLLSSANLTDIVSTENPYKVMVSVSPSENSTLDIDHIRFSPLNSDFQATTYNFRTKEIKEIINGNGLIKRYLHNDFQDRILSINENGEIEKFSSYTKSSSTHRIVPFKSKIEIQPNGGFYEDFQPYSFIKRWVVDNDQHWEIAPREIHHKTDYTDQLKLRTIPENLDSYGIRLLYSLKLQSSKILFNKVLKVEKEGNRAIVEFSNKVRAVPTQGEILLIVERNRLMVWIDGGLYFDEGGLDKLLFDIQIYGEVTMRDVLVFVEPSIQVTYFNALGGKVQEINLESENRAFVTEFLYDELGRHYSSTKPVSLQRSENETVVAYYSNYVSNRNPSSKGTVSKLGRIEGTFEVLKPYNFYQIEYDRNPLNDIAAIGLPGQEFSIGGKFAKRFSSSTENSFIKKHYPSDKNYRHHVEHKLGLIDHITVLDERNNKVASLVKAPGQKDLLATYEYDDDGKLTHMLPPLYHNSVRTPYKIFGKGNNENENPLSVTYIYDAMGNLISKTTPDSGKVEFVYSDSGQLKFNLFYSSLNTTAVESVVYFDYDSLGRLTKTGKLISPPAKESLLNLKLTKNNTEEYQVFYHSDFERLPKFRGRLKRTITRNDGVPFIEESLLNEDNSHSSKRVIVMNNSSDEPEEITTNKIYRGGKLMEIEYPAEVQGKTFKVTYHYDKLGRIQGIRSPTEERLFVEYTYNSDGLIETEHHVPDRIDLNFIRKYNYNSASFLTQLQDKFLTENIHYTEGSYGDRGYGDGTITRTEFEANWHQYADSDKIGLNEQSFITEHILPEQSKLCFDKLKSAGYIDQNNRQAKIYYPFLETNFPQICSEGIYGRQIQSILGEQGFPSKYGHLYNYGAYQELIKAKYFIGEDIPEPLQPDTFAKLPKVNESTSRDIWKILTKAIFIIPDRVIPDKLLKDEDVFKPHGKRGVSFVKSALSHDLTAISDDYKLYHLLLENALICYYSKKLDLSSFKSNLQKSFSEWSRSTTDDIKIQEIIEMLDKKGYLKNPLNEKFNSLLKNHQSIMPEIVGVLFEHFSKQLGEAEFDLEAYEIDANGNHKHFYNGFDRYKLDYRSDSNQISTINFHSYALPLYEKIQFPVKYDSRGNIIQAFHKGIQSITYHSVSNRATNIELVDGKKLIFYYDAQGERILKRVLSTTGDVKKEVSYVRDEFGRSLVEQEVTWSSPTLRPSVLVTLFIYGPSGLVGFIRRDQYYSVITDHEGSIRLVVNNGKVVAAYDYLPYGNLMRQYGSDADAHISYRYIGQEWDEETGLYNYHARFYDPSIGRFYQHDPKMQYFSPYKYAGNSPVSIIDRDGEVGILARLVCGAAGAYLGGAAVNHNWNPVEWNYKDPKLYLGIILGGIGGALIPTMIPYSFRLLGLGAINSNIIRIVLGGLGAYSGAAGSSNEWNPAKWNYSDPDLWNSAFIGATTFAGAPTAIKSAVQVFKGLPTVLSKSLFIGSSALSATVLSTIRLTGKTHDFSKPGAYYDLIESVLFAADIPMAAVGGHRFFKKNIDVILDHYTVTVEKLLQNPTRFLEHYSVTSEKLLRSHYGFNAFLNAVPKLNSIWKNPSKIAAGIVIPALTVAGVSAATNEGGFDFTQPTTYEGFINTALMASGLSLHAFSSYSKRGLTKKRLIKDKLIKYAEKSEKEYMAQIKAYTEFTDAQLQNRKFGESLRNGEIPNSVVAVAIMDDGVVFVAYSGWEEPGFISAFRKDEAQHLFLKNNKEIGSSEVTVNDVNSVKQKIEKALAERDEYIKKMNHEAYLKEKDNVKLFLDKMIEEFDPNLNLDFNPDDFTKILNEIETHMVNTGYAKKATLKKIFDNVLDLKFKEFKPKFIEPIAEKLKKVKISEPLSTYNKELLRWIDDDIRKLARVHGFPMEPVVIPAVGSRDVGRTVGRLRNNLNSVNGHKSRQIADLKQTLNKNKWNELYNDHFEKYSEQFTPWDAANCAEPHCVSLIMRSPNIFRAFQEARYVGNIKYLGAFDKKKGEDRIPAFKEKKRCDNCKITTEAVANVVTDPEWEIMINNEIDKLPLSSFFPYHNITDAAVHNITNERSDDSTRKKRSIVENEINDQDLLIGITNSLYITENKENDSGNVETDEIIGNAHRMKNVAGNLFSWMRTSLNHLFDSKKIFPKPVSTPTMLEGITDSKSNLSTATALVDVNSTILLLDTMMRKLTGQKYISRSTDNNAILLEARGYSLDVGLAYEKALKYAALKSGISMHRFNNHYIEIQDKVIDKIMNGRLDEIAEILISHAKKACPLREKGCPGKLSPKKFNKFMNEFMKRIDVELQEIMQTNKRIKT